LIDNDIGYSLSKRFVHDWLLMISANLLMLAVSTTAPVKGLETAAEIINSGSTNTRGYILYLKRWGPVAIDAEDGTALRNVTVAPDLLERFFQSLNNSKPLDLLPSAHCPKSKSFGYSIQIKYDGATSPDLTCAVGDKESQLAALCAEIARQAHVSNTTRRNPVDTAPQSLSPPP
jgi:hypothetical protein